MSKVVKSEYDYYNDPDRILIGVDINTHIDLFEDAYSQYAGRSFDWDKNQDDFDKASDELDHIVENVFASMFGHQAVEEFHDDGAYDISVYCCTFWGDRNNPDDIKVLQELQGKADDKWTENNRAELAIYDEGVYGGPDGLDSFVEKWGEMGAALAGSVTVGVSFPEEFDADHMNDIKSSRKPIKSGYTGTNVQVEFGPYGEEKEFPFFDMKGMTDEEIDDKLGYYEEVGAHWGSDGESYMILEDHAYAEDKIAVIEDDYLEWQERYYG